MLKRLAEQVMRFGAARWVVRLLIQISSCFGRGASFLKTRAIMQVPTGTVCHWSVDIKYPENISFEGPVIIGPGCTLGAKGGIKFGTDVRISKGVLIETASLNLNAALPYPHIARPIVIEEGVWLGANVIVLGGVRIGAHAVVGAGTVISQDVSRRAIVVGSKFRTIERKDKYGQ